MPLLARACIKAGLVYLALALMLGVLVAAQPLFQFSSFIAALRPLMLHLLIVGWISQLIIGVAYWMFPKQSKELPRGSVRLGWIVFICLNAGLILRSLGEPLLAMQPGSLAGALLAASAVLQVTAGWLFIANTWGRVKER